MTGRRAAALVAALVAAVLHPLQPAPVHAQPRVVVAAPAAPGPLADLTPRFEILAEGFSPADEPLVVRLELSLSPVFAGQSLLDTTLAPGERVVRPPRPLPSDTAVYWRARARTAAGIEHLSAVGGPGEVPAWLRLVAPNEPNGTTVASRRPTFVWSSGDVAVPPGPWLYRLQIIEVGSGRTVTLPSISDTTYTPDFDLESNTPYRWAVTAVLQTPDTARASSAATVVVLDATQPLATLLYQNFPNPFPTPGTAYTCVWFDLHRAGAVQLEIFDLRGNRVRRLVPTAELSTFFAPGRYGRETVGADTGCDPRFAWDGTDDRGDVVPGGVYLVRLTANGRSMVKKILFRGR
jgi:hypothetical protein